MGDHDSFHNPLSNYKWQLHDPAKTNLSLRRSAPRHTPYYVRYLGCSYEYLILYCEEQCFLVDVYTSTMVKPHKFRRSDNSEIYYGVFTAPLSSPNSCLLLFSRKSMFRWQVGTKSWTEHSPVAGRIHQIVSFKGQMLAMDSLLKLNTISLAPQFGMSEVPVVWGDHMAAGLLKNPWLVVCGDMLLKVDLSIHGCKFCFQAYRLDLSVKPTKWAELKKLENWALFVSLDRRSSTFCCLNPERWGGKSNCIYVPSRSKDFDKPWIEVELGKLMSKRSHPISYILGPRSKQLESFWVLPSLVYGVNE
uniref:KIB1-4 beta-propeller domain-containing protein n=1 Tax=Hordeum vulgare subsp. vulgare TaxID=112509 RepID=A0A8I7BI74_HORVV